MTIRDIQKRYGMTAAEAKSFLVANIDHINEDGEHAKNVKRSWKIDDEGVRILDELFGYKPPEAEPTVEEEAKKQNPPVASVAMQQEVTRLTAQNQELVAALSTAQQANEKLQKDLDDLQGQFLSMQEGSNSLNSTMIRKYQAAAEKAQNESKLLRQRLENVMKSREEQSSDLNARIDELTSQLAAQNDLMKEKLEASYKLVEAKKNEERLYSELNSSKAERDELNHTLEGSQMERAAAMKQVADIRQQVAQAIQTMRSVELQLRAAVTSDSDTDAVREEVPVVKAKAPAPQVMQEAVQPTVQPTVQPQPAPQAAAPSEPKAIPSLAPSDVQPKKEGSASSAQRGIFHRVACFLGF